jgi:hypothetical protein
MSMLTEHGPLKPETQLLSLVAAPPPWERFVVES